LSEVSIAFLAGEAVVWRRRVVIIDTRIPGTKTHIVDVVRRGSLSIKKNPQSSLSASSLCDTSCATFVPRLQCVKILNDGFLSVWFKDSTTFHEEINGCSRLSLVKDLS
jgi:hypothetical protein